MTFNLNMRTIMMVSLALVAAALTALMTRGWLNAEKAAFGSNGRAAYHILVAKNDVPAGYFVKAQDLRWQGWPKGNLAPSYIQQGKGKPEDFAGAVARTSLIAGQPVTRTMTVRPGEQGFMAAVLRPGMRAVSIQVNAISGIAGFVMPGDRVDMVLTHTVRATDSRNTRLVSETVLQELRVLAVDQKFDDNSKSSKASIAKTVTLEVTPKQVEKIGIVNRLGKVSLSLRPIAREAAPSKATDDPVQPAAEAKAKSLPAAAGSRPARLASADLPAKFSDDGGLGNPGFAPGSGGTVNLMPMASAQAAEISGPGAPVKLFDAAAMSGAALDHKVTASLTDANDNASLTDAGIDPSIVKAEADARSSGLSGPFDMAAVRPPVRPAKAPPKAKKPVKRDRPGITLDSEVSRALGLRTHSTNRTVSVMRGGTTSEQKF
jgi:pilus assembly protein CpaB